MDKELKENIARVIELTPKVIDESVENTCSLCNNLGAIYHFSSHAYLCEECEKTVCEDCGKFFGYETTPHEELNHMVFLCDGCAEKADKEAEANEKEDASLASWFWGPR